MLAFGLVAIPEVMPLLFPRAPIVSPNITQTAVCWGAQRQSDLDHCLIVVKFFQQLEQKTQMPLGSIYSSLTSPDGLCYMKKLATTLMYLKAFEILSGQICAEMKQSIRRYDVGTYFCKFFVLIHKKLVSVAEKTSKKGLDYNRLFKELQIRFFFIFVLPLDDI